MKLGKYKKFWVALAGALVTLLVALLGNHNAEVNLLIGVLTALGVYSTPNSV